MGLSTKLVYEWGKLSSEKSLDSAQPIPQTITKRRLSDTDTDTSKVPRETVFRKEDPVEEGAIREKCFTNWDTSILGIEPHHFASIWLTTIHIIAVYYCYLMWFGHIEKNTIIFEILYAYITGMLGINIGCHRYWTHKTFKANLPFQILMMVSQSAAGQYPIHKWCLYHRLHHKYTDTNSDPHNSKKGFLFSHIGFLYLPKHPELKQRLKTFDMSDLEKDPIVRFQSRWYLTLLLMFSCVIPVAFIYYWFELPLMHAVACNCRRYLFNLHPAFFVNSLAHRWGDKPYDKNISSVENALISIIAGGEGWHNYHHTFPWDYRASEFGWKINPSTMIIDFFAWLGWAWDMKTVSPKMLRERLRRTGDGSHPDFDNNGNDFDFDTTDLKNGIDNTVWGWDDDALKDDFKTLSIILYPKENI